jgi:dTDP-4-dehydrorhamnose 3,5-epimerase|uniref:dTDP-4-dehydrorhamnose 3,5-epimerase n=1 Tax=Fluviicola sp. TaxID=1917219 RepID=UPI004049FA35
MTAIPTDIKDVFIIEPMVLKDERGVFFESFQQQKFNKLISAEITFVQENESISKKNVLRGLHFQKPPFAQGKLVRVIAGSVIDVAVDIRKNSSTYGKHVAVELSAKNKRQLWIPAGFAHGFVALEDDTVFQYKCTNYYNKAAEDALLWNDETLEINWEIQQPILSPKDELATTFNSFISPF